LSNIIDNLLWQSNEKNGKRHIGQGNCGRLIFGSIREKGQGRKGCVSCPFLRFLEGAETSKEALGQSKSRGKMREGQNEL